MTDMVPYGPNARLNVTYRGSNGDLQDPISYDLDDDSVRRIATESIRDGYIIGVDADPDVDLTDFVIDRFPPTGDLPARVFLRPKTPFGK